MDEFQKFVVTSNYCRWLDDEKRRETWRECVDRYYDYFLDRFPAIKEGHLEEWNDIREMTFNLELFPSMRALMTAGKAADRDDTCLYNCSYLPINSIQSFSDILYILCCGTGVGFSCERSEIDNLPTIPTINRVEDNYIVVGDSREGWARAYSALLSSLYNGIHPTWETHLVRPRGSRLKTFGGRASGPEPLEKLFKYTVNMFYKQSGQKLTSLNVHDLVCMIGEVVISGGVRRSALISLSDLDDREMSKAKSGPWWEGSSHRSLSNNSAVYEAKPTLSRFMEEWALLYDSRSGERGICNREAMNNIAERSYRSKAKWGTNPCSEIILRPKQFCNLSEVVIRSHDTEATLRRKVRMATILGTIQSACTKFTYLDHEWKNNCEDERLLGVSFTGIYDSLLTSSNNETLKDLLTKLKEEAHLTNEKWAEIIGIEKSKSITCCKPSGTTSCVANTSSGIHPRFSEYYIRRVRIDTDNPLCAFMKDRGVVHESCVTRGDTTTIFSFPVKSPNEATTYTHYNPLDHLELWLTYQKYWCDHKPSVTVNYTDNSFLSVGQWIYDNWEWVSGISFLPQTDHVYEQAPFEAISKEHYLEMVEQTPANINWENLSFYELEDTTTNTHTLACSGGTCEVVDLVEN